VDASRPGSRDPRRPGGAIGGRHSARKSKRHGDEDGVGQVGKDDGESSRRLVRRVRANDSKASRLGGRSDTRRHRRFDRFGLKTRELVTSYGGVRKCLTNLALKPGETSLTGLGLKTGGGLGTVKVRAELASRQREVEEEPCPPDMSMKI